MPFEGRSSGAHLLCAGRIFQTWTCQRFRSTRTEELHVAGDDLADPSLLTFLVRERAVLQSSLDVVRSSTARSDLFLFIGGTSAYLIHSSSSSLVRSQTVVRKDRLSIRVVP